MTEYACSDDDYVDHDDDDNNDDDDDDGDVNDDDDGHLLIEVDGAEASSRGNDAEQVENPVKLNF